MKTKELIIGFVATALAESVAVWSVGGDDIILYGFIIAMVVILFMSCGIRLMLASATKETNGQSSSTDWQVVCSYCLGSVISTVLVSLFVLL